jgi:hypothetical protein
VGTAIGWLTATCSFAGRRLLRIELLGRQLFCLLEPALQADHQRKVLPDAGVGAGAGSG